MYRYLNFIYRVGYCLLGGFVLLLNNSCLSQSQQMDQGQGAATIKPYTEGIRIGWDFNSLQRLYDGVAFYPRMIRLANDDLLCAFESKEGIFTVRSKDDGKNWQQAKLVAPSDGGIKSAVPELIQLDNGRIILAYNRRPPSDNQDKNRRFGIKIRTSDDGGHSWTAQQNVFEGGYEWHRGVWEPAMIQLETGEIQLFFANEYPYSNSNDQQISMVRSTDNGNSWSNVETISYRQGHRDGMPVPLILNNGNGIAVAIEDNGMGPGQFKPAIIWSSLDENWEQGIAKANSERRWRALKSGLQLDAESYGGAPYLRQLPSGQTLLSFQSNEERPGDWSKSTMVVAIGDESVRHFSRKSLPFDVPHDRSAMWNSIFIKNDTTVTALTSTNAYSSSGRRELYIKDGYVFDDIRSPYSEITVDGKLNEMIWKEDSSIFIGSKSSVQAIISTAWDNEYLYVGYLVTDESVEKELKQVDSCEDGIAIMFANQLLSNDSMVSGTYKVCTNSSGNSASFEGKEGSWRRTDLNIEVASQIDNQSNNSYQIEIAIPWSAVNGKPEINKGWGINFQLASYDNGKGHMLGENSGGNIEEKPSTWSKIQLIK